MATESAAVSLKEPLLSGAMADQTGDGSLKKALLSKASEDSLRRLVNLRMSLRRLQSAKRRGLSQRSAKSEKSETAVTVDPVDESSDAVESVPLDANSNAFWHIYGPAAFLVYLVAAYLMYVPYTDHFSGTKTNPWVDAAYFSVVTVTSVGYGDIVPATPTSKIFIAIFVFLGIGLVYTLLSGAGVYLLDKQEEMIVKGLERVIREDGQADKIQAGSELEQNGKMAVFRVCTACGAIALQMVLGILVLVFVEGLSVVDAVYCVCITVTTVGYGDIGFVTLYGRLFGIVWLLTSTLTLAWAVGTVLDVQLQARQRQYVIATLKRALTSKDIIDADLNHDGKVEFHEFCLWKLQETQRVSEEEIKEMQTFFDLHDKDGTGHLDVDDLKNCGQSS